MARNSFLIDDGIIVWFNGPEWDKVAEDAMNDAATAVQEYAQSNAPWEDQTGDARAGLKAEVENTGGDVVLSLGHTVDYGLWLEVIQNGRFAIIMPTLESEAPRILEEATKKIAAARKGRG